MIRCIFYGDRGLARAGYAASAYANADAALPTLQGTATIDLLFYDFGRPGMNGRQMADIVRVARPTLPVLFITG